MQQDTLWLVCLHVGHRKCLLRCFNTKGTRATCPVCRTPVEFGQVGIQPGEIRGRDGLQPFDVRNTGNGPSYLPEYLTARLEFTGPGWAEERDRDLRARHSASSIPVRRETCIRCRCRVPSELGLDMPCGHLWCRLCISWVRRYILSDGRGSACSNCQALFQATVSEEDFDEEDFDGVL